jgi:hypothetical protein
MSKEHKYGITYDIKAHEGGVPADNVLATGRGACDSFMFISCIGEPGTEGPLSTVIVSGSGLGHKDGEPIRELEPHQQYGVWAILTAHLQQILPEGDPRKELMSKIFGIVAGPMRKRCNAGN